MNTSSSILGVVIGKPHVYYFDSGKYGNHIISFKLELANNARYVSPIFVLFSTTDLELAKKEISESSGIMVSGEFVHNPFGGHCIFKADNLILNKIVSGR